MYIHAALCGSACSYDNFSFLNANFFSVPIRIANNPLVVAKTNTYAYIYDIKILNKF